MKNSFPGYYSPSKEDVSKLWNHCVFIFDANVLLNLYRYTASTANELINILSKISERIWVPHQAALEYQKDRLNVISQQSEAYEKIEEWLEDVQKKLENELGTYTRHPLIDAGKIIKKTNRLFDAIKKELNKNKQGHPDLIHIDTLRDNITSLFDGKVGSPYKEEQLEDIYKKGDKRYKQSIPPGFSDVKKEGTGKYGDLVLWLQIIDNAKEIKKPIIFVTDDRKEDWWYKFKGETIGPHPKLVEEIKSEAGVLFYMYHTEPFMKHVQDYLKQKVEQKAIQEVREVQRSLEDRNVYRELSESFRQTILPNEADTSRLARELASLSDLAKREADTSRLARELASLSDLAKRETDTSRLARELTSLGDLAKRQTDYSRLARELASLSDLAKRETDASRFVRKLRDLTDLAMETDTLPKKQREIIQKGDTKKSDSEPNKGSNE